MATDQAKKDAHTLVKVYLQDGTPPNCWPHLRRDWIAIELHNRIDRPYLVNQNATNLCGLATPLFEMVQDDPLGYVTLAITLYMTGEALLGQTKLKPSEDLRRDFAPSLVDEANKTTPMAHADWMILASIRQAYNTVLGMDYRSPLASLWSKITEPVRGLTVPNDVVRMLKDIGYKKVLANADWKSQQSWDNALEASSAYRAGYRVILLINANLLKDETMDTSKWHGVADHWVGLESSIVLSPANANYVAPIYVYTWGDYRWTPEGSSKRLSLQSFLMQYYGYIAAKY